MAIIQTPMPQRGRTDKETIDNLFSAFSMLRKELEYFVQHVDSDNVTQLNTNITRIKSKYGETEIDGPLLIMKDRQGTPVIRIKMGYDKDSADFIYQLMNAAGDITVNIDSNGNLTVERGTFKGAITIGSGNNVFKAGTEGIWLGHALYINAPFKVGMNGAAEATNLTVKGGSISGVTITIGSGDNVFKVDENGHYLGSSTFADAPFRVGMDGAAHATNLTITGGSIAVETDLHVGNNIYVGNMAALNKTIYLYNNGVGNACMIRLDELGGMHILNEGKSIEIYASGTGSVTVAGQNVNLQSGNGIDNPNGILGCSGKVMIVSNETVSFDGDVVEFDNDEWGIFGMHDVQQSAANITRFTTETAGSEYSLNEQMMLGHIKTDITQLFNTMNGVIDKLQRYGIFSEG